MIEAKALCKSFKNHTVLKGLDLNVQDGEIYGFLGLNGAGKTTTMNILTGLSGFDSGSCKVLGVNLMPKIRQALPGIGYLQENPSFYPFLTAREYLSYIADIKKLPPKEAKRRVEAMLELSGIKSAANRRIGGYSRGMRQRLGLGAVLLHNPKLIFLDEPTSALDPEGRQAILDIVVELKKRGRTVFLSTHLLDDAEKVCDRVGILQDGKVVLDETLSILMNRHLLPIVDIIFENEPGANVMETLKNIPNIRKIQFKGNSAVAYMSSSKGTDDLFLELARLKAGVQSFQRRRSNLQEIFLETAKEA